jgi:hypothetical protein
MKLQKNIDGFISLLVSSEFKKTIDNCDSFSKKADLYFHEISFESYELLSNHSIYRDQSTFQKNDKKYFVVVNHFGKKYKPDIQGFDLWLSVFNNEYEIGNKVPVHNFSIQLSCESFPDVTDKFFESFNQTVHRSKS